MSVLEHLEPEDVFSYFEEICAIPHGSGNTEKISGYCVAFAKEHGLSYRQDKSGNVIIKKPASPGYENAPTVMLQGHLDMVCEKNADSAHDFTRDGLRLSIMDDDIFAKGTTLGADDGIAVAFILAVLAKQDCRHPALEAVFTVDEEVGMLGADAMDFSDLKSTMAINIDCEDEGVFYTSCAGGVRGVCILPVSYEERYGRICSLTISGLKGGHSGADIHKYRANANVLMGRLLYRLSEQLDFDIVSLYGGMQDNAIPREAQAKIVLAEEDTAKLEVLVHEFEQMIIREYDVVEENISIYCEEMGYCSEIEDNQGVQAVTGECMEHVIAMLMLLPDGVQKMSAQMPSLVQTSLNLGIMRLKKDCFKIKSAIRSSVSTEKDALNQKLSCLARLLGGNYEMKGDYPAWEYSSHSELRRVMSDVYSRMFGKEPACIGIHAGLECGVIYERMRGIDIVSFGPDIRGAHTPRERLSISSTERSYRFLLEVLAAIH